MNFPKCLNWGGRKIFPEYKIISKHYMYARHKPGSDWKEEDEYPDFSKIRSTQSFNWSAFSIPIWTRFNDRKEYNADYGVIGYSVKTIRFTSKFDPQVADGIFEVKHKPDEFNYSHCELYEVSNLSNKTEKRAFRMALVHRCSKELRPYATKNTFDIWMDYIKMYWHRFLIFLSR
jgi:hypothetical protein